mmetsp:Transcript_21548/g.27869  ORF Transcript_21548/g.27869 Transcript_21548/m.27869 type:complete len:256 (+) Transcript_21548:612-1379(+)
MLTVKKLPITLFPPSHPVIVFKVFNWVPFLDGLAKVTFNQLLESINTHGVNQVLHASIGTNFTVAVVSLSSDNRLQKFHAIFLGDKSQVISRTSKGVGLVVSTTHTSTNHNVETFQLAVRAENNNETNIVGVDIQRVISRDSNTNFEFSRKVSITVQGFNIVFDNDTTSVVVVHDLVNVVFLDISSPHGGFRRLAAIKPNAVKGWRHGTEKFSTNLGPFTSSVVGGVLKRSWCAHDITTNITTCTNSAGANIHDG